MTSTSGAGSRSLGGRRRYGVLTVMSAMAVVTLGCSPTPSEPSASRSDTASDLPTAEAPPSEDMTNVASLGLSIAVPPSFVVESDPQLDLLAVSRSPRAILSISGASSSIVQHEARPGETVKEVAIHGRDAVTVLNANLADLPPGIVTNELLVDNGSDSFSLILSSDAESLAALWQPLVESIQFDR